MASRTRLSPLERRSQLLDLGAELFATHPYDEVLIEQVAEIAGVSRGLLYHYFPTKRDFFAELLRRETTKMLERTAPDPTLPLVEQLTHGIDAYLEHCRANEAGVAAFFWGAASGDPDVRAIIEQATDEQARRILTAIQPAREPHPLLEIAVRSWLLFMRSACHEWLTHRDVTQADVRDLSRNALINILLALPHHARPEAADEQFG